MRDVRGSHFPGQDPFASLDPRMTINEIIAEPLRIHAADRANVIRTGELAPAPLRLRRREVDVLTEGRGESTRDREQTCDAESPGDHELLPFPAPCRDRRTADTPVVMLTARMREGDVLTGFRHGAQDYLTKPVSVEEVANSLKLLLKS